MSNLRTFQARTMAEALALVKRELGDDAVILHTRTFTRGGLLGVGGRTAVEVTAGRTAADLPAVARRIMLQTRCGSSGAAGRDSVIGAPESAVEQTVACGPPGALSRTESTGEQAEGAAEPMAVVADASPAALSRRLLEEVHGLKSIVAEIARRLPQSQVAFPAGRLAALYAALLHNEVSEELADAWVARIRSRLRGSELADTELVRRELAGCAEALIPPGEGIDLSAGRGPTLAVFVGPTGVGKTTTVAKLAADYALRRRKKVALVTLDALRIGAVDQLRTYAEIIGVPLKVASSPAALRDAVAALDAFDLVLIDAPGCGPADGQVLEELRAHLVELASPEVHLCLSLTAGRKVLEEAIGRFASLGVNRLLFTKLDEAVGCGVMLTCLQRAQARLSYLTTGQNVPQDIEVVTADRVAQLMVAGVHLADACGPVEASP